MELRTLVVPNVNVVTVLIQRASAVEADGVSMGVGARSVDQSQVGGGIGARALSGLKTNACVDKLPDVCSCVRRPHAVEHCRLARRTAVVTNGVAVHDA